ncbi:UDP-N-acetylglucosamine 1-carboxyvinyltransferase [Candidatus Daviesbacteria bacterium RIFCSPHIGHO2_01_FULL_40_11]|uniref:UDP-N-acetylglucosamine 1-carboxyvinyltransferase n=1 Tax=Candidatus Daviesbacteria bacterium RIFCSPHIGHO2_01_FULL_40_11 TaxID=1797762 RepID=A0A1F5JH17_9BACT|nr:MAG: UDP-N-acetylglucosamine 1-carboxyvinyltransferase [Candidatus Daviesbacteria bacterium RIFCSPHIGHO2_01_FULL_40_11]OGE62811.1 MAG: UDP-N-acetylglucosamine 1-carboxyvinyltransferase [Candidatus Daviesbacteria bacterium RIFCSPLOWO2_01_FULL_40_27]
MKYIINGGHKLEGTVCVSGNKNSVFPCIGAALLTSEEVILENISNLVDTEVLIQILKKLGVVVEKNKSTIRIKASEIRRFNLPEDLMMKLRGSIILVGAILGRLGKVNFFHPGGDIIGRRSIETHVGGFKALGTSFKKNNSKFSLYFAKNSPLANCDVFLPEASVTATENLILASVLGSRVITLKNCAKEPHVSDLCRMLTQMGANIVGIGTDTLIITGVNKLNGTKFRIGADYIEVGTYVVAAAITGGEVTISGLGGAYLDPVLSPLKSFGIKIEESKDAIIVYLSKLKSTQKLVTNIWPGFPTDLMSVAIVLATQSKGVILCHDWMYEGRMFFIDKLITMGAKITLADPHRVLVYGQNKLRGKELETPDIRAGMALVVAALVARGRSVINQAELIERGYEDVVMKLRGLGADIERVEV